MTYIIQQKSENASMKPRYFKETNRFMGSIGAILTFRKEEAHRFPRLKQAKVFSALVRNAEIIAPSFICDCGWFGDEAEGKLDARGILNTCPECAEELEA